MNVNVLPDTFKNLWSPQGTGITTPEDLQRYMARVIYFRALVALLAFTALIGVLWTAGVLEYQPLLIMLTLDLLTAVGLWLNVLRRHRVSPFIIIGIFFGLGVSGSATGGVVSTSMLFYVNAILLSSHLVSLSAMWILAALSLTAHFTIGMARTPVPLPDFLATAIPSSGAILGLALLESYVARVTQDTLEMMQAKTRALEDEIVERGKAEDALRGSEKRYREVVEQATDVIFTVSTDGHYTFANAAALRLSGFTMNELREQTYTDLILPEYQRYIKHHFLRQYVERTLMTYAEYPFRTKRGEIIWLGYNVSLQVDGAAVRGFHVIGRDISERKKFETALRHSEEHYRNLFELANDAIIIFEPDSEVVLDVNRRACELYGFSREEFIGKSLKALTKFVERGEEQIKILRERGVYHHFETEHYRRDGSIMNLVSNSSLVEFGGRQAVLSINRDITERKRSEEALRNAQKMESLGVLAGGIAHDFNNLLQAMLGQSALALARLSSDHSAFLHIRKAERAAVRAAELTQQLLAYSGRGKFQIRRVNLNALLQENIHLFEVSIPKNVRLEMDLGTTAADIEADSGQIQQLVMNLIMNAGEAVGEKAGRIYVRTRREAIGPEETRWSSRTGKPLRAGAYVIFQVEDNGSGMSRETQDRMFDPFFTTKFTGRGLGLAAVLGIIRGHNGGLVVESEPGRGTIFSIALPALAPIEDGSAAAVPSSKTAFQGKVLVIDDEAMVREVVTDILESEGIEVVVAEDGLQGLTLFQSQRGEIGLVLLDLSMPGMGGEETFRRLKEIDARVPIVISSGYSETEAMSQFEEKGVARFIQKPYRGNTLIEELKKAQER